MEDVEAGFAALYVRHHDAVLRYASRRTSVDEAHDVAAETFVVAWRRLSEVPDEALPWLIAVTRRVLANQRRGRDRQHAVVLRLSNERPSEASMDDQVETRLRWRTALASLSPHDQEVLALVAWDGLTTAQAAASLGCSSSAFAMRLLRARRRLAQALREAPPVSADVPHYSNNPFPRSAP